MISSLNVNIKYSLLIITVFDYYYQLFIMKSIFGNKKDRQHRWFYRIRR